MKYYQWKFDTRYLAVMPYVEKDMADANPDLQQEFENGFSLIGMRPDNAPLLDSWVAPRVVPWGPTAKAIATKRVGDVAGRNKISSRMLEHLGDILKPNGRLYPLEPMDFPEEDDRLFYYYLCENVIDCLDHERSKFDADRRTGKVSYIRQCYLDHSQLTHEPEIFALSNGDMFVSEVVKERIMAVKPKLMGLELYEEGVDHLDYQNPPKPWRSTATVVKQKPKPLPTALIGVDALCAFESEGWERLSDKTLAQMTLALDIHQGELAESLLLDCVRAHEPEAHVQILQACEAKLVDFEKALVDTFNEVLKRSKRKVKGWYFEYYYDGSDESVANVFLCEAYHADETDWASEFEEVVGDIPINPYFDFDPDDKMTQFGAFYASHYIAMSMINRLAAYYQTLDKQLPLAFACHDWDGMINIPKKK